MDGTSLLCWFVTHWSSGPHRFSSVMLNFLAEEITPETFWASLSAASSSLLPVQRCGELEHPVGHHVACPFLALLSC